MLIEEEKRKTHPNTSGNKTTQRNTKDEPKQNVSLMID